MSLLLAADIGGTKSALAVFDLRDYLRAAPLVQGVYANRDFSGILELVSAFLGGTGCAPEYACLAVAGVVGNSQAEMTNLPWAISESLLAAHLGFAGVWLINDLTAVCSSLPILQTNDWIELQSGQEIPDGVRAVIAPGTGLGEGFLAQRGGVVWAQGTEGGHCDFAPTDVIQADLLDWMRRQQPWPVPVSYERLCSGLAIPTLYAFFKASGVAETKAVRAALAKAEDQTPVIVSGALDVKNPCFLCRKAVDLFLAILGAEAGNLALKLYSTGG